MARGGQGGAVDEGGEEVVHAVAAGAAGGAVAEAEMSVAPGVVRASVMVVSIHSGMAGLANPLRLAAGSSVARGTMVRSSVAMARAISSA